MQTHENKQAAQPSPGIEHLLNMEQRQALDELIASGEAVFNLIRFSKLDTGFKNAFYQLEKQFDYYKERLTGEG